MHDRLSVMVQDFLQKRVTAVHLAVGELVSTEAQLRALWHELTLATPLAPAALHIRIIRAEQQCMTCFEKYHPENLQTRCPRCGSVGAKILAGEEFRLESFEEEA